MNLSPNSFFCEDEISPSKENCSLDIDLSLYAKQINNSVKVDDNNALFGKNQGKREIRKNKPLNKKLEFYTDQIN